MRFFLLVVVALLVGGTAWGRCPFPVNPQAQHAADIHDLKEALKSPEQRAREKAEKEAKEKAGTFEVEKQPTRLWKVAASASVAMKGTADAYKPFAAQLVKVSPSTVWLKPKSGPEKKVARMWLAPADKKAVEKLEKELKAK